MDPRDPRGQEIGNRRVSTVRDALIQAGVPAHRIQTGAFGDSGRRNDRRVEVLMSSGN
jgi:outer membrane protein OmpA-like peptidoglycan-associated protein